MTSENQHRQSPASMAMMASRPASINKQISPPPPPIVVTATSITELLNSHTTIQASLNGASPISSSNNMTTVVPHPADVTAPCTSSTGTNSNNFRSSPFLDSNNKQNLPSTALVGVGPNAVNQPFGSNAVNNNGRPPSNVQTPPYHNHFRQQQQQDPAPATQHVAVRGKTDPAMAPYICAKCNKKIVDRYLLEALEKYWHEDCLKCDACDGRLGELGSKLYFKNNNILCQRDYLRIFRPTGTCAACTKTIPAFEQVMRAGTHNVYHLECFACQECNHRFCIGDKFYLDVDHNKILCEYDYEERMVFAQMAYNYNSLAQLKRQISQQVDDFDEVQPVPPR